MALSGSNSNNFVTKYYLSIEWSAVANSAKTSYTVTANVYLSSSGSGYPIYSSTTKKGTITIAGTSYSFSCNVGLTGGQKKLLGTASKSGISGGANITVSASVTMGITFSPGGYINTVSVSSSGTLDALDVAAPTVKASVSSTTLNSISISWSANASCSSVQYSINGGASYVNASGSGTSGSFTISGLYPGNTYQIAVRAYGKSAKKYGAVSLGSVTTKDLTTVTPSSIPDSITLTRDNTTSRVYFPETVVSFDITNPSGTAGSFTLVGKGGTIIRSGSIRSAATSLSIILSSDTIASLMKDNNDGTIDFTLNVYCGGKTYESTDAKYYCYDIYVEIASSGYTAPVIQAIYGNLSSSSCTLYCLITFIDLISSYVNIGLNSTFSVTFVKGLQSGSPTKINLTVNSLSVVEAIDGKALLYKCTVTETFDATSAFICEVCDGFTTRKSIGNLAIPTANNKASIGIDGEVKCVEFIEGLPILWYVGGNLGGTELIETGEFAGIGPLKLLNTSMVEY